jgi:hypothetical protein
MQLCSKCINKSSIDCIENQKVNFLSLTLPSENLFRTQTHTHTHTLEIDINNFFFQFYALNVHYTNQITHMSLMTVHGFVTLS